MFPLEPLCKTPRKVLAVYIEPLMQTYVDCYLHQANNATLHRVKESG